MWYPDDCYHEKKQQTAASFPLSTLSASLRLFQFLFLFLILSSLLRLILSATDDAVLSLLIQLYFFTGQWKQMKHMMYIFSYMFKNYSPLSLYVLLSQYQLWITTSLLLNDSCNYLLSFNVYITLCRAKTKCWV